MFSSGVNLGGAGNAGASVSGSNGQVQFNNGGVFGASPNGIFDSASGEFRSLGFGIFSATLNASGASGAGGLSNTGNNVRLATFVAANLIFGDRDTNFATLNTTQARFDQNTFILGFTTNVATSKTFTVDGINPNIDLLINAKGTANIFLNTKVGIGGTAAIGASTLLDLQNTTRALKLSQIAGNSALSTPENGHIFYDSNIADVGVYRGGAFAYLNTLTQISTLAGSKTLFQAANDSNFSANRRRCTGILFAGNSTTLSGIGLNNQVIISDIPNDTVASIRVVFLAKQTNGTSGSSAVTVTVSMSVRKTSGGVFAIVAPSTQTNLGNDTGDTLTTTPALSLSGGSVVFSCVLNGTKNFSYTIFGDIELTP
jgi:hypothetical protein